MIKRKISFISIFLFIFLLYSKAQTQIPYLEVSENGHYLRTDDGKPFFYLGDTSWLLAQKLDTSQIKIYLDDRKSKGFNVIQIIALHNVKDKDVYGNKALQKDIINEQNFPIVIINGKQEKYKGYWYNLKWIVNEAARRQIYVGIVPIWGNVIKEEKPTTTQIYNYTSFLCNLLSDCHNVIWILGGDIKGDQFNNIWDEMGNIIRDYKTKQLITFHPRGRCSSSQWFQKKKWLDFNMVQSGHKDYNQDSTGYGEDNWRYIKDGYSKEPIKPIIDGEPSYEGIPHGLKDSTQIWTSNDIRRYAYWSVLSGGCGFTYGNNSIIQMYKGNGDKARNFFVKKTWQEALNDEGAKQMIYLKRLIMSLPYNERRPDSTLITDQEERYDRVITCRGDSFIIAYTYTGRNFTLKLPKEFSDTINGYWYNPRNGDTITIKLENKKEITLDPPGEKKAGNDIILVLDARKQYFREDKNKSTFNKKITRTDIQ